MLRHPFSFVTAVAPLFAVALALGGCAAEPETTADADESAEDDLSAASNTGFFQVTRRDARRCAAPGCGGYFVARVNAAKTRCADGTYATECYVSALDFNTSGLSGSAQNEATDFLTNGDGIVKGAFKALGAPNAGIASFSVKEVWKGATGATPSGSFYRLADSGIRCVTTPCPSLKASKLNSAKVYDATGYALDKTSPKASAAAIAEATTAAATANGFLIATKTAVPNNNALVATEFYTRFAPTTLGRTCGTRGGTICSSDEFCSYSQAAACGTFDAGGSCTKKPQACTALYQPVCGCDGRTYGNACSAANQGISVKATGACP